MLYTLICLGFAVWAVVMLAWALVKTLWDAYQRRQGYVPPKRAHRRATTYAYRSYGAESDPQVDPDEMPDSITPDEIGWAFENPHTFRAQTLFGMMDDDDS